MKKLILLSLSLLATNLSFGADSMRKQLEEKPTTYRYTYTEFDRHDAPAHHRPTLNKEQVAKLFEIEHRAFGGDVYRSISEEVYREIGQSPESCHPYSEEEAIQRAKEANNIVRKNKIELEEQSFIASHNEWAIEKYSKLRDEWLEESRIVARLNNPFPSFTQYVLNNIQDKITTKAAQSSLLHHFLPRVHASLTGSSHSK